MEMLLTFGSLAAVIVVAAMFLSRYADGLADQTGLGKTVTGLVLLAGATSLPEFSLGFSAVRMKAYDLTAGDVMGSSLINLLILAVLDLVSRTPGRMLSRTAAVHALSGIVACLMTAIAVLGILLKSKWTFYHLGACSWALIICYVVCCRLLYMDQKTVTASGGSGEGAKDPLRSLSANTAGFVVCAVVIFLVAPKLAHTADALAVSTGLGRTFFGTVFVAFMTSLPEMISTFSAIRIHSSDMAIGNILGSNAFNMLILALTDAAGSEPILSLVSPVHAITGVCVVLTTCVTLLCLLYRAEKRWWVVEPDAALVALMVLGSLYLVYVCR